MQRVRIHEPGQAQPPAEAVPSGNADSNSLAIWSNKSKASGRKKRWTEVALATSGHLQSYLASLPPDENPPALGTAGLDPADWDRRAREAQLANIDRVLRGNGFNRLSVPQYSRGFDEQVLKYLTGPVERGDEVVRILLLAGHGRNNPGGSGFEPPSGGVYLFDTLKRILEYVPSQVVAIPIVDCCFSGILTQMISNPPKFSSARFAVIATAQADQTANMGPEGFIGVNSCYRAITSNTLERDCTWPRFEDKLKEGIAGDVYMPQESLQVPSIKEHESPPPFEVFKDIIGDGGAGAGNGCIPQ